MNSLLVSTFWIACFLIVYPYLIYPLVLKLLNALKSKPVVRDSIFPSVTVLIPAFNEADCIEATVMNKIEQDYPEDKLEIIVVSDESTDGTDEIVNRIISSHGRVKLIRQVPRRGKASGLNMAVKEAGGEIIVFSDANSLFDKQAVRKMVENFNDPSVGYLTGKLIYQVKGAAVSEQGSDAYMNYENKVREIETNFESIIGANGGVDAIRKELYKDIPQDQITDFVLPLHVIEQKKRVVFDKRVKCYETPNAEVGAEFRMRVRVSLRALRGMFYMRHLLNPFKYGRAAFGLVSHKLIRYLGPWFMLLALLSNMLLVDYNELYKTLFVLQMLVYALAVIGLSRFQPAFLSKITKVPSYFLMSNLAFFMAVFRLFKGETMATWKPRQG